MWHEPQPRAVLHAACNMGACSMPGLGGRRELIARVQFPCAMPYMPRVLRCGDCPASCTHCALQARAQTLAVRALDASRMLAWARRYEAQQPEPLLIDPYAEALLQTSPPVRSVGCAGFARTVPLSCHAGGAMIWAWLYVIRLPPCCRSR